MVGAPGHGKYVVDGLNYRDKQMIRLEMENILNSELILDDLNVFKFMQVHEN